MHQTASWNLKILVPRGKVPKSVHIKLQMVNKCKYLRTGHPHQQCPAYGKKCGECGKCNHLKVVCRSSWGQQKNWWTRKTQNEMYHEGETSMEMQEEHDQSSHAARIKYINLSNNKSVLFTNLEPSTSQKQTKITYKIDSRACEISCHSKY